MTVFAITRVRDEADIIGYSLRRMAQQVDHIIIGEGHSTDGTREIIEDLIAQGYPITLHDDRALNYEQREVMTQYAHEALERGADWVVPYDTDEVWEGERETIKATLEALDDAILIAPARLLNHTCTTVDPDDPDPFARMGYREIEMLPLPKVAARTHPELYIHHGNHAVAYTGIKHPPAALGVLSARHFPYRSPEQFVKRVKIAYPMLKNSGLPRTHGQHMWEYGETLEAGGEEALRDFFNRAMVQDPDAPNLIYDPLPPLG